MKERDRERESVTGGRSGRNKKGHLGHYGPIIKLLLSYRYIDFYLPEAVRIFPAAGLLNPQSVVPHIDAPPQGRPPP
jgi:hypothetical protein